MTNLRKISQRSFLAAVTGTIALAGCAESDKAGTNVAAPGNSFAPGNSSAMGNTQSGGNQAAANQSAPTDADRSSDR
jgi:hypothetical protein